MRFSLAWQTLATRKGTHPAGHILVPCRLATAGLAAYSCLASLRDDSFIDRQTTSWWCTTLDGKDPQCVLASDSFTTGVTIHVRDTRLIVTGVFAVFLADVKAHKELACTKGASGSKVCITCSNVLNRVKQCDPSAGSVCVACCNPALFQYNTNADIYAAHDHIGANLGDRAVLEQRLGLKYESLWSDS